jgi:hypothetical protein
MFNNAGPQGDLNIYITGLQSVKNEMGHLSFRNVEMRMDIFFRANWLKRLCSILSANTDRL